jgi:hypothetical protein
MRPDDLAVGHPFQTSVRLMRQQQLSKPGHGTG